MATTYNNIVQKFTAFFTAHKMINTYLNGATWTFNSDHNIYPAAITVNDSANIVVGQTDITFALFVVDIVNKDLSNKDEIYSDCLQIVEDFIATFKDNYDTYGFWISDEGVDISPIEEEFDDILCGWQCNVTVTIPRSGNTCQVPI